MQRFAILERSALCKVDSKKHVGPVARRSGGDQRHESRSFAVDTSKISERIISGCRKFQDSSKETRNVKVSISYPPSEVKTSKKVEAFRLRPLSFKVTSTAKGISTWLSTKSGTHLESKSNHLGNNADRSQSAKANQQNVSSSSSRTKPEIEKDFPDKEKRVPSISSSSSLTSNCEIKGEKAVVYKRASQKNDSTATLPDDYVVPCQVLIPIPGNKSPCSTLEELGKRNAILLASSARRPKFCSYLVDSLLQESESKSDSSSQKSTGLGNPVLQEHQDIGWVDEATLSQVTGKRTVMDKPGATSNGALREEQGVHPVDALEMADRETINAAQSVASGNVPVEMTKEAESSKDPVDQTLGSVIRSVAIAIKGGFSKEGENLEELSEASFSLHAKTSLETNCMQKEQNRCYQCPRGVEDYDVVDEDCHDTDTIDSYLRLSFQDGETVKIHDKSVDKSVDIPQSADHPNKGTESSNPAEESFVLSSSNCFVRDLSAISTDHDKVDNRALNGSLYEEGYLSATKDDLLVSKNSQFDDLKLTDTEVSNTDKNSLSLISSPCKVCNDVPGITTEINYLFNRGRNDQNVQGEDILSANNEEGPACKEISRSVELTLNGTDASKFDNYSLELSSVSDEVSGTTSERIKVDNGVQMYSIPKGDIFPTVNKEDQHTLDDKRSANNVQDGSRGPIDLSKVGSTKNELKCGTKEIVDKVIREEHNIGSEDDHDNSALKCVNDKEESRRPDKDSHNSIEMKKKSVNRENLAKEIDLHAHDGTEDSLAVKEKPFTQDVHDNNTQTGQMYREEKGKIDEEDIDCGEKVKEVYKRDNSLACTKKENDSVSFRDERKTSNESRHQSQWPTKSSVNGDPNTSIKDVSTLNQHNPLVMVKKATTSLITREVPEKEVQSNHGFHRDLTNDDTSQEDLGGEDDSKQIIFSHSKVEHESPVRLPVIQEETISRSSHVENKSTTGSVNCFRNDSTNDVYTESMAVDHSRGNVVNLHQLRDGCEFGTPGRNVSVEAFDRAYQNVCVAKMMGHLIHKKAVSIIDRLYLSMENVAYSGNMTDEFYITFLNSVEAQNLEQETEHFVEGLNKVFLNLHRIWTAEDAFIQSCEDMVHETVPSMTGKEYGGDDDVAKTEADVNVKGIGP